MTPANWELDLSDPAWGRTLARAAQLRQEQTPMTNSIHRVQVDITDYQELDLTGPPLFVAADRGGDPAVLDLWFEHYDERHRERHGVYPVYVIGTGNLVPWDAGDDRDNYDYLGSVITSVNQVWHVYVGPEK